MLAVNKQSMSDLLTGWALFEESCSAGRAGIRLILSGKFLLWENLVGSSAVPGKELKRADADGILTNRAEKLFICFPVLPHEQVRLWKCFDADEMDKKTRNDNYQGDRKYILEVTDG